MKIIYEQGDIVFNRNNESLCIVLRDSGDSVQVLEKMSLNNSPKCEQVMMNFVPKGALEYKTRIDLVKQFDDTVSIVKSLEDGFNYLSHIQAKEGLFTGRRMSNAILETRKRKYGQRGCD